jgi:hypothetical protein
MIDLVAVQPDHRVGRVLDDEAQFDLVRMPLDLAEPKDALVESIRSRESKDAPRASSPPPVRA